MSALRRIQRDKAHEDFVKEITSGDTPLFREIWRLLLLAASIGVKEGKREPLKSVDSSKAFPETYFSAPGWKGFLYLIALKESGDSSCLHNTPENQEKLITAFEEYSNYGLGILKERLEASTSKLDDLTSFVLETTNETIQDAQVEDLI